MQKKAVILFSGGLDSTTCLAIAKKAGYTCYALSFNFSQKHIAELDAAKKIAHSLGVAEHVVVQLQLASLKGNSQTDETIEIPDYQDSKAIPSTYVPARNTIFLSIALGWAETVGASDIFIGANIMDYSGYPDCRPEYLRAFEHMANLATKAAIEQNHKLTIHAPLLQMTKAEIIKKGLELGLDYKATVSCYRADAEGRACGKCDSCTYRKKGFLEANVEDPTIYI